MAGALYTRIPHRCRWAATACTGANSCPIGRCGRSTLLILAWTGPTTSSCSGCRPISCVIWAPSKTRSCSPLCPTSSTRLSGSPLVTSRTRWSASAGPCCRFDVWWHSLDWWGPVCSSSAFPAPTILPWLSCESLWRWLWCGVGPGLRKSSLKINWLSIGHIWCEN